MKHYGDVHLQSATSLVMNSEASFPSSPTAGRMVFVDKRVWVCTEIVGTEPTWIPLTNKLDTHIHHESVAATTWTVTHNLSTSSPLVQIYDSTNKVIIPDSIEITSGDVVTVSFSGVSVAGRAVVMHGSITGSTKPVYNYTHTQSVTNTIWYIPHNLGYYPIVRVFIAGAEIQPQSIIHDSVDHTTITFSTTRVGTARLI